MKIAVIGSGNVGRALAISFKRGGHQVVLAGLEPTSAAELAAEVGVESQPTSADAVRAAEMVVLAIPFEAAETVAQDIRTASRGYTVVDVTNPLLPGASGLSTAGGPSGAEAIQALLPDAHVVKGFNTMFASVQADPTSAGDAADAFVAGDDEAAKARVLRLAAEIGCRPIDVGGLVRARELESMAFLLISMQVAFHGAWTSVWKLLAPPAAALRG